MQQKIKNAREEVEKIEDGQDSSSKGGEDSDDRKSDKAEVEDGEPLPTRRDRRRGALALNMTHAQLLNKPSARGRFKFSKLE